MNAGKERTDGDNCIGNVIAKVGENVLLPTPLEAGVKDAFQLFQLLLDPLEKKFLAWYMLTEHPERMDEKDVADFVREHTVNEELLPVPSQIACVKFKNEYGVDLLGWYEKYCKGGKKRLFVPICATTSAGGETKKVRSDKNNWKRGLKYLCRICKLVPKKLGRHNCRPTLEYVIQHVQKLLDEEFQKEDSVYYRIAIMVQDAAAERTTEIDLNNLILETIERSGLLKFDPNDGLLLDSRFED